MHQNDVSGIFISNFKQIEHDNLAFLLLTFNL